MCQQLSLLQKALKSIKFWTEHYTDFTTLLAIGGDGSAVNTRNKGSVFPSIELFCKKSLHWGFVCKLRGNELPFRHVMRHLDGDTTSPKSYFVPIGKQLHNCDFQLLMSLRRLIPQFLLHTKLFGAQTRDYLLDIWTGVKNGFCPENLSKKNPGKLSQVCWLTTANRIMCVYIGTQDSSNETQVLTEFIISIFAPSWFTIKPHNNGTDEARNLFKTIQVLRYLTDDLKIISDRVN